MRRIGLLYHPKLSNSLHLVEELRLEIEGNGLTVWTGSSWDREALDREIPELDLLITFGGDGTIMRAARASAPFQVPILGVNMGRLGFLTELAPDQVLDKLPDVLEGRFWLEKRMMLRAELFRGGRSLGAYEALNDVVVGRGAVARVVRLGIRVEGAHLTSYLADGVILSTATGSTGYCLAAGGPILPPEARSIIVVPIAPCLGLLGPLVLSEGVRVRVELSTHHQAVLTMDGQVAVDMADGDVVAVGASERECHFVRMQPRDYFYGNLERRLKGE
jgi:NAD+ kinase